MLESDLQARRDALQIVRQQILSEVPGRHALGPGHSRPLIGAHEHAAALLAHVDLAFEVDAVQLLLLSGELRHVLGDEVLMFHRQNGQLEPDHASDFACPQPRHVAMIGDHVPGAIGTRLEVGDTRVPGDLGPADLSRLRVGMGHAVGVDMAFDRVVHRAREMPRIHQWKALYRLLDRDDLQVHP